MPTITATVKGGFWAQYGSTMTLINGKGPARRQVARALFNKGTVGLRRILFTLDGAVAGSTATKNLARVQASDELGGKRVIENEVIVNRATTAQDVTDTKADLLTFTTRTYDDTPVANGDMNPLGTR